MDFLLTEQDRKHLKLALKDVYKHAPLPRKAKEDASTALYYYLLTQLETGNPAFFPLRDQLTRLKSTE